ncbi:MAG: N-acetylmuramoyl-L-alanine amidase [Ilumatobacteraceae bacterium]|nr:N-acetylmuramoyl-L-alanine amidase [Ilumatobacteraceae bacterium]
MSSTLVGLPPARLLDTRIGAGFDTIDHVGAGGGPVSGGSTLDVHVAGRGGVPSSGASAVALNVTVVDPTSASYITVYPAGQPRPLASNLNMVAGQAIANMVIVPIGVGGNVTLFNNAGATDLVVDVLGWWPPSAFDGLTPARLLDTRTGPGIDTIDHTALGAGSLGQASTLDVTVVGRGGVPATGVGAVAVNITAAGATAASYVTAFPAGQPRPVASNLNTSPGETIPNMAIVPVGADGKISLYNNSGSTDLVVDVLGWFPTGASYSGLTPERLLETRSGGSFTTIDHVAEGRGALAGQSTLDVQIGGRPGIPASAGAVALNVTAIDPTDASYLTVYPTGHAQPVASNLNFTPGQTIPNMVIVPLGAGGKITLFNNAGRVDVAIDVLGWFAAPTPATNELDLRADGTPTTGLGLSSWALSADGRYSVFSGDFSDLPGGNAAAQIGIYDRTTRQFTMVDTQPGAPTGNPTNDYPAMSKDASTVAYWTATATGDRIAVWDRATNATTFADVPVSGSSEGFAAPAVVVSATGRFVLFDSSDDNLVNGDHNHAEDVFVRDRTTGTTTRIDLGVGNAETAGGSSRLGSISADGRYVTFESNATNLVSTPDMTGSSGLYLRDTLTSTTTLLAAAPGGSAFFQSLIAADGSTIYYSREDAGTTVTRYTITSGARAELTFSHDPTSFFGIDDVSTTGRFLAFNTAAADIVPGDTNNDVDTFIYDATTGTTTRASLGADGTQPDGESYGAGISDDGTLLLFDSDATNIVIGTSHTGGVFLHDPTQCPVI